MTEEAEVPRRPGVFDIRVIIAVLIGLYGLVITVLGLFFTTDAAIQKSAGVNINLWAGLGMLVTAAGFVLWARLRPLAPVVRSSTAD